ncbi:MAG: hypothetical protein DRJ18_03180, partial [Candidatus Methanomethylicota archaeon]
IDTLTTTMNDFAQRIIKQVENIQNTFTRIQQILQEALSSANSQIETTAQNVTMGLKNLSSDIEGEFNKISKNMKENFEAMSNEIKSQLDEMLANLKQTTKATLNEFSSELSSKIADLTSRLNETKEKTTSRVSERADELKNTMNNIAKTFSESIEQASNKFMEGIKEISETTISSISQQIEEINRVLENLRKNVEESLKKTIEDTNRSISELRENIVNSLRMSTEEAISTISKRVEEESTKLGDRIRSMFSEAILKETKKVLVGFEETLDVMLKLYEETVKKAMPEKRTVWLVRGISGVEAHIKDMITRAKTFVILVLPSLDQVPLERIAGLRGLVRVQIVARILPSSSSHIKILNQLRARRGVHVRSYEEGNIIGCVIDGKEAVFAVIPPRGEVYGIATSDENWVNTLQGFLTYIWTTAREVR